MKLSELAELAHARTEPSDGDIEVTGAAGLDQAEPGHVTFLSNPRYTPKIATTGAFAIFVGEEVEVARADLAVLRAKDPYLAFTRALIAFHPRPAAESAIHASAVIDQTATIGAECFVGPNAVVGKNSRIGDGVRIHANATIYENVSVGDECEIHSGVAIRENTVIGQRVIIHNNAVLGCDGFGFAKHAVRHWLKIP